jgi:hypothetical protein
MPFKLKLHLVSVCYCAVLVALNWSRSTSYSRPFGAAGVTHEAVYPVALAAGLSVVTVIVLCFYCLWKARSRLERGSRVAEGRWIQSYSVILYAFPLFFHRLSSSTSIATDGSTIVHSGGYGHPLSSWVFCFAVAGLLLLQIAARLSSGENGPRQPSRGFESPVPRKFPLRAA